MWLLNNVTSCLTCRFNLIRMKRTFPSIYNGITITVSRHGHPSSLQMREKPTHRAKSMIILFSFLWSCKKVKMNEQLISVINKTRNHASWTCFVISLCGLGWFSCLKVFLFFYTIDIVNCWQSKQPNSGTLDYDLDTISYVVLLPIELPG